MVDVDEYVTDRLRNGNIVKIQIVGRKREDGYLEMDWIIDKKIKLKDFPFEVFEGETTDEVSPKTNKAKEKKE